MKIIAVFILAAFPSLLIAQSEPSGKKTLLRFTSFGLSDSTGEYVLSAGVGVTTPFLVPSNGFSPPIEAPAGKDPLAVGKLVGPTFRSLATLKLPDAGKRFLVMLFPGEKDALRTMVIRADDPAFRPGNIMLFNLSAQPLAADLGGEKLRFAPSSQTIFRPERKDELANYQVRFSNLKQGKTKLFAAGLWPYFNEKRAFVFLYVDPSSGSPTYTSIDEFTDWLVE